VIFSIPPGQTLAPKRTNQGVPPGNLSSGTFEKSSANQHFLSHFEREREREGEGGREKEKESDESTICVMPHYLRLCQRPVQLVEMVSPRHMAKWWLAFTVERLLVIDLATGPWLSVGMYFDLRFKLHSRQAASGEYGGGWDWLWHSHDSNHYINVTT
jgi:hypothetical protein